LSGNSLPRPPGSIDASWFKKRVQQRRAREKLAKAARKKNRGKK
jgi:hypothetical protein